MSDAPGKDEAADGDKEDEQKELLEGVFYSFVFILILNLEAVLQSVGDRLETR